MTKEIINWLKEMQQTHLKHINPSHTVLDVGSLDINGSGRDVFGFTKYLGVDMMRGKGVDHVVNGHDLMTGLDFIRGQFDLVLCMETFEHDDKFWLTLENIKGLTKTGGYMIITTPTFKFPIHRHPKDYYRFGEDIYRDLFFKGFEILDLREVFGKGGNPGIVCLGKKL